MSSVALTQYLAPFSTILDEEGVEEIMINEPGTMFVERSGKGIERISDESLTYDMLFGLARLVANYNKQALNENDTLLSASLPTGERIQIVLPPSLEPGKICFAIRKPSTLDHSLASLGKLGLFDQIREPNSGLMPDDKELIELRKQRDFEGFLIKAVEASKNIVVSGGTSSGKTTLVNAMIKHIPLYERVITIEDAREVQLPHENKVHLLASKGGQGTAKAGISDLFASCLRLRPDKIMLSEIRGPEAYDFLNSVTSGHPGSITTIHADSVRLAIERMGRYVGDHPSGKNIQNIEAYIKSSVDIIVQVQKDTRTGKRAVIDIGYDPK